MSNPERHEEIDEQIDSIIYRGELPEHVKAQAGGRIRRVGLGELDSTVVIYNLTGTDPEPIEILRTRAEVRERSIADPNHPDWVPLIEEVRYAFDLAYPGKHKAFQKWLDSIKGTGQ